MVSKSMLSSLLEKQLTYTPEPQPFYTFRNGSWQSSAQPLMPSPTAPEHTPLRSLHLITWNIDFMASQPRARMRSALEYLKGLIETIPRASAVVICFQEMMESENHGTEPPNDLTQIANASWVREMFNVTDVNSSRWGAAYGQVTLIDKRLAVSSVQRLRFVSEYQRDALFVDIQLAGQKPEILRLCNVHLDSSNGPMRPIQWKAVAKHLQNSEANITASILAGDCNANLPRDKIEPQDNGFKDAYLELGGIEGDEQGATWGFQSIEWRRWGRQRLDKEVFWGELQIEKLERIGQNVQVDETARRALEEDDELPFVTDHYGLMGEYTIKQTFETLVTTQ